MSENIVKVCDENWIRKGLTYDDENSIKEKYIDNIFKHRKLGYLVRVVGSNFINWGGFHIIYEQNKGREVLPLIDFDTLFEPAGKAKYTEVQLDKMKFIIKEQSNEV